MKKAYLHKTGAMVFNQEGHFEHVLRGERCKRDETMHLQPIPI